MKQVFVLMCFKFFMLVFLLCHIINDLCADIYQRRPIVCQFATPLSDDIHTKPEVY